MTPEQLLPHLPQLRRYARLLTGEQSAGDAIVEQMLERLLANGVRLPAATTPRSALFKSLVSVLAERRHTSAPETVGGAAGPIDERLRAISPLAREVFLLVTVEEFSLADAAEVLDMTPAEVARHLEEAGNEIARQIATTVLIIEDEPLIAMTLESIVEEMGHSVAGVAATKDEAVSLMEKVRPGLILADIQLADGSSGLDAIHEKQNTSCRAPAVFITAFPERLLTGAPREPAFLITKPFAADQVKAVVSQTLFFRS